ncbi:MAG: histidine phosphatase family protein [Dehalococcoidales bacterium]|nr:histidine phosphatase family protein [Dehalococcoidales bacterium]
MPRLYMVRHGQSEYNVARRFAGAGSDIELTAAGVRQAGLLRDRLASEKIDAVYSSNLKRAMSTAAVLSENRGMEIVSCPELGEIDYGAVEGKTFDEVSFEYPMLAKQIYGADPKIRFPGGESFEEFTGRGGRFLDRITKYDDAQTVLVVGHSGSIKTLVCRLLDIDINNHWGQIHIDNASLTVLETGKNGAIISLLNDTSHLR